MLQNHYVEINIDRSDQYSRYWCSAKRRILLSSAPFARCHSGLYAQLYIFAERMPFYATCRHPIESYLEGAFLFFRTGNGCICENTAKDLVIPDVIGRNYKGRVFVSCVLRCFSARANMSSSLVWIDVHSFFMHLIYSDLFPLLNLTGILFIGSWYLEFIWRLENRFPLWISFQRLLD